jgi:hypothetical protein
LVSHRTEIRACAFAGIKVISDKGYVIVSPSAGYVVEDPDCEPAELPAWVVEEITAKWKRAKAHRPSERPKMPKIAFWDADHLLPRLPTGAVALLAAKRGAHKTNLALTWIFDAMAKGARVLYAGGEGFHGVITQRVPAHAARRGINLESIDDRLLLLDAVPLLTNETSVEEFIEQVADETPKVNIIVIDTLATATAGLEENGSQFSAVLTDNGPVDRIRNAFNALLLIHAHEGKDASKGVRRHSGTEGNVDALLILKSWPSGGLDVLAEKIKDGKDGVHAYYKVPPKGSEEIPVPQKITFDNFMTLTASDREAAASKKQADEAAATRPKTQAQRAAEAGVSLPTYKRRLKEERERTLN